MKPISNLLLSTSVLVAAMAPAWAQAEAPVSVEAGAMVAVPAASDTLPEAPLPSAPVRLRESLSSWDTAEGEKNQSYPYRLSADERRRMREQLRGQAPAYRTSTQ
ncbi:MAG: hypothetical protein EP306_11755 [Burkholderiales bacterium]|nr:MAG: hypothetical protein EP306_11755 [Burkholderiales bacterium]